MRVLFESLVNSIYRQIAELQSKLKELRPLTPAELRRLREEFMIENTYDSNAIEGNSLTLRETALILQEGLTIAGKPLKEHLEAIGHKDAFDYVLTLAERQTPLSETVIKNIHSLVLMNDSVNKGKYRSVPVRILGAAHTPPPPYLVAEQMERLLRDYEQIKQERPVIEAAALFHLRLEGIHPFIDGNGRTGRLILNLELIKEGLLPVNIKFSDRKKYYDCFDAYFGKEQTILPLADLIAQYELAELKKYVKICVGV